ncbi:hypothetical protein PS682_03823 [Pseudomonas fluorescens]|nr:hypothetical protein PS682_03823 [Pseudomonas fluorescens]
MAIHKVGEEELFLLLNRLSGVVDLSKDLPANIFMGDELVFWFFERPLICLVDVFAGLVAESVSSLISSVFIKFSGAEFLEQSCFSMGGKDVNEDVIWLNEGADDFFGGKVGYPIYFFNGTFDWVAFESAYEEFGVIAVKSSALKKDFEMYLNANFISMRELRELASGSLIEARIAKALIDSYGS